MVKFYMYYRYTKKYILGFEKIQNSLYNIKGIHFAMMKQHG